MALIPSFKFPLAKASATELDITSVIFPREVPYNQSIPVSILVSFSGNFTPAVSIYYWIVSNSTSIGSGWRIVAASPIALISEQGAAIYSASLPSVAFPDVLAYGMKIVFWVDAVLGSVRNSTAQGVGMWNPKVLQGKFLVRVTDPYSPTIQSVSLMPQQPTSSDNVTIEATFAVNSTRAPVTEAELTYGVNRVQPATSLNMTRSSPGIFEATIPVQATGSHVFYSVTGIDAAGYSVQGGWNSYQVSPSPAEMERDQAEQARLLEMAGGAIAVIIVILSVLLYRRRTKAGSRVKSLAARLPYYDFTTSVILSIAVVGWAAYSILQFGHAWLALVSLLVLVELWGLADPRLGSVLGFKAPSSGLPRAVFETFRKPGAPLLVSAYTLIFFGTAAGILMNLGGLIDRQGLLAIMHFFASYAFLMVGLGAAIRYFSYALSRGDWPSWNTDWMTSSLKNREDG